MRADRNARNTQAYLSQRVWRSSKPVRKQKQRDSPIFLPCCLKASHQPPSCHLKTTPENTFWLILFFFLKKAAENSLLTLLSFVVLCLPWLILYLELGGFALDVCKTWPRAVLLRQLWLLPGTLRWIKLHETEAQQLEKGFEDFIFFFKYNIELTGHLGAPCHNKSLR